MGLLKRFPLALSCRKLNTKVLFLLGLHLFSEHVLADISHEERVGEWNAETKDAQTCSMAGVGLVPKTAVIKGDRGDTNWDNMESEISIMVAIAKQNTT